MLNGRICHNNLIYFQFQHLSIISFNSFPPFLPSHLKSSPGTETYNEGYTDFCNFGMSHLKIFLPDQYRFLPHLTWPKYDIPIK